MGRAVKEDVGRIIRQLPRRSNASKAAPRTDEIYWGCRGDIPIVVVLAGAGSLARKVPDRGCVARLRLGPTKYILGLSWGHSYCCGACRRWIASPHISR
jgi:hypothetical protein